MFDKMPGRKQKAVWAQQHR